MPPPTGIHSRSPSHPARAGPPSVHLELVQSAEGRQVGEPMHGWTGGALPVQRVRRLRAGDASSGRWRLPIVAAAVVSVGFAIGTIAIAWHTNRQPLAVFVVAESFGLSFVAAGLIAWSRQPRNRTGQLMVFTGVCWYVGNLEASSNPV